MPRRRIIDPEFWQDTKMATLPIVVRHLFIGTWNHADDAGLFELDAKRVKSAVFPHDERIRVTDVAKHLDLLIGAGRLLAYEVEGRRYAVIARFHRHQTIEKPTRSRLPRPPEAILVRLDPKHRQRVIERSDPAHVVAARQGQEQTEKEPSGGEASPNGGGALTEESGRSRAQEKVSKEKRSEANVSEENARARASELRSETPPENETELERLLRLHMTVTDAAVKASLERKIERLQATQEAT